MTDDEWVFVELPEGAEIYEFKADDCPPITCYSRQLPRNPPTRPVLLTNILGDAKPKGGFEFL
jgi:hypothetical protein